MSRFYISEWGPLIIKQVQLLSKCVLTQIKCQKAYEIKDFCYNQLFYFLHKYYAKVLAIFNRFQNIDRSLDRVIGIWDRDKDGLLLVGAICRQDKSQLSAVINK